MSSNPKMQPKVTFTKDIVQIIRDILLIFGTLLALWKAPPIVDQQETAAKNKAIESKEKLRSFRIGNIQKLNSDILDIDQKLKESPWTGSPTWDRLKAVRDLKEKELIRLENEIKQDKNPQLEN